MSEAISHSKGPGLIRRISRGAANKLSRRRTSTHSDHRDQSSGPMVRRRSESRSAGLEQVRPFLDAEEDDDEGAVEFEDLIEEPGAGIASGIGPRTCPSSPASGARTPNGPFPPTGSALFSSGDGPIIPSILQHGTFLTKVTKKKRKTLKFVLDREAAKVCWDPSKPNKRFYIDDIRDIRTGRDARNYREECGVAIEFEARWFTLVVAEPSRSKGRPFKTIHLIAPNSVIFDCWIRTLEAFSQHRIDVMTGLAGQDETAIRALWGREMSRISSQSSRAEVGERLNMDDLERLCRGLHLNCAKDDLRRHFVKADIARSGSLDFAGFSDFMGGLKERQDLKDIYNRIAADPEAGLDRAEFLAFVRDSQGAPVDRERVFWDLVFDQDTRRARSVAGTPLLGEHEAEEGEHRRMGSTLR